MDLPTRYVLGLLLLAELVQFGAFWFWLKTGHRDPLRRIGRIARELAQGQRPRTSYIDGPPAVQDIARHLDAIGDRLDQYQREQRQEEFSLNVLLGNMVEGVMVVDRRHVVRLVNEELLKLFDVRQSPVGRTVLESLREARVDMLVGETLDRGEARQQEVTLESTSLDQPTRHFDISAVPLRTKPQQVEGAVVVFHDITRIKQLEVLRQEFVSNVSHELRTPLAIFRGYLEMLQDNPKLPRDEHQRVLETLQRHSDRLHALVEDLMVLTRLESRTVENKYAIIRMEAFLRQIVRDWGKRDGASEVDIKLDLAGDLPEIEGDALRLEQVILNVLENAVAYSNPPRKVALAASTRDGEVEIRVSDNGIGIPPADLPRIFERFYRVDKARSRESGGTGLGLAIVNRIVQSHGGSVHAESEVGKGTTIVMRLPVRQKVRAED
jgi:two-component system phosphate regulon sensor histidine kinase PhoR